EVAPCRPGSEQLAAGPAARAGIRTRSRIGCRAPTGPTVILRRRSHSRRGGPAARRTRGLPAAPWRSRSRGARTKSSRSAHSEGARRPGPDLSGPGSPTISLWFAKTQTGAPGLIRCGSRANLSSMITLLLHLLRLLPVLFGGHRQLALENLALP